MPLGQESCWQRSALDSGPWKESLPLILQQTLQCWARSLTTSLPSACQVVRLSHHPSSLSPLQGPSLCSPYTSDHLFRLEKAPGCTHHSLPSFLLLSGQHFCQCLLSNSTIKNCSPGIQTGFSLLPTLASQVISPHQLAA